MQHQQQSLCSSLSNNNDGHQFVPSSTTTSGSPSLLLNGDHQYHYLQQLSTSTTMIHSSSPQSLPKQQGLSSVSTCHPNVQSPPIISTTQGNRQQLMITAPPSQGLSTSNLSPFSFNGGGSRERDRAISSPPPLSHMKKHLINPTPTNNPSPNSNSSGGSGLTSPNCSDQMNLDDDCMDQTYEERPRRFSLPSNDLINMPFFRQKPQNLTSFHLFNPDTPINEPEIELKDITGMTVLSHSDCREQYEMLVEELKEFNLYFSCDNI